MLSLLTGCQGQKDLTRLQAENGELKKELVQCEKAKLEAKAAALQCEMANMPIKYGGVPVRTKPIGSDEGAKRASPDGGCKCVEGDPMCTCF